MQGIDLNYCYQGVREGNIIRSLLKRNLWKIFSKFIALRRAIFFLQAVYDRTNAGIFIVETSGVRGLLCFFIMRKFCNFCLYMAFGKGCGISIIVYGLPGDITTGKMGFLFVRVSGE